MNSIHSKLKNDVNTTKMSFTNGRNTLSNETITVYEALYLCPLDKNFGVTILLSYSIAIFCVKLIFINRVLFIIIYIKIIYFC